MNSSIDITGMLSEWRNGNQAALEQLVPLIYEELHRLASHYLRRERADITLQTTDLLHDVWVKLAGGQAAQWENRAHFFGFAAQTMRHLLIDHARQQQAVKHGGAFQQVELEDAVPNSYELSADLLALDEALKQLAKFDARKCQIVEFRYFSGLSAEETAEALGVSVITVKREWSKARAWLYHAMNRQVSA